MNWYEVRTTRADAENMQKEKYSCLLIVEQSKARSGWDVQRRGAKEESKGN